MNSLGAKVNLICAELRSLARHPKPFLTFSKPFGGGEQLSRAFSNAVFKLTIKAFELSRFSMEIDKYPNFGPQDLRNDRNRHIVHSPALIAAEPIKLA